MVILGPTALGKTELALEVAGQFDGELIACDSRQVYRGLKLGVGKGEERVWMYDVVDPKKQYSVVEYVKDATKVVEDILGRGKLPIIVGGTGLYLRGLLGEIADVDVPPNEKLRRELEKLPINILQSRVATLSPIIYQGINRSDLKNKRRLIRKIEQLSMYPYMDKFQRSKIKSRKWDVLKIGLIAPRPVLNARIDQRVLSRLDQGMVAEVVYLHKSGLSFNRMKELGLEYGIMAEFLDGSINYDQMVEKLKNKIHQYARRQLVWFKKDKDIVWFDITDKALFPNIVREVKQWYYPTDA